MDNWPRTFAYCSFIAVIGLAVVVLSEEFIQFIEYPGWEGYAALFGYGIIYLNFSFVLTKRYLTKSFTSEEFAYLLALLLVAGPLMWIFIKDLEISTAGEVLFIGDVAAGALIGAYFGIKRGVIRRAAYVENLREYREENELKRPHDDLSRN